MAVIFKVAKRVKGLVDKRPPAQPRSPSQPRAPRAPKPDGPGKELEKLLAAHWIKPDAPHRGILGKDGIGSCMCKTHSKEMDQNGCDWCLENQQLIAGWMKAEAKRRGWKLFSLVYAKFLVRRAVKSARKNLSQAAPAQ